VWHEVPPTRGLSRASSRSEDLDLCAHSLFTAVFGFDLVMVYKC
jgi:hypothetical protein